MHLFFMAVGAVVLAVGTAGTEPAQAALLDFSFTTVGGNTGSFTLNTDIAPVPGASFGSGFPTGFSYPEAVTNLSFSAPYINLSSPDVTADFEVAPAITSEFLGLPPGLGVLGGSVSPSGCSRGNPFTCLITVGVLYSGDVSGPSPILSDNPLSYPAVLNVDFFDPTMTPTGQPTVREFISNFQVVPEPSSVPAKLAFGIGGAGLLIIKRKMNRKKVAIRP